MLMRVNLILICCYLNYYLIESNLINSSLSYTQANDDNNFISSMKQLIFNTEKGLMENFTNYYLPATATAFYKQLKNSNSQEYLNYIQSPPPSTDPHITSIRSLQTIPITYSSYPQQQKYLTNPKTNVCYQAHQIGTGPYRIPRWFYNAQRLRCELFYWSGCCGNGNNFLTQQACQQLCEEGHKKPNSVVYVPFTLTFTMRPTGNSGANGNGIETNQINSYYNNLSNGTNWNTINQQLISTQYRPEPLPQSSSRPDFPNPQINPVNPTNNLISLSQYRPPPHQPPLIHPSPPDIIYPVPRPAPPPPPPTIIYPSPPLLPLAPSQVLPVPESPFSKDPCREELDIGWGDALQQRHYFNSDQQICQEFNFRGTGGNSNNFLNLAECQRVCQEAPNPCSFDMQNQFVPCSSSNPAICSGQQFCHIGEGPSTTVCCTKPALIDPCNQPLNIGIGNSNLQRYYYNPSVQQCQNYIYKGLQGNENNFPTLMDCENQCQTNPCTHGQPYRSPTGLLYCSSINICPNNYYCHIGADARTSVCCESLEFTNIFPSTTTTITTNNNILPFDFENNNPFQIHSCEQPLNRGVGNSNLVKFYYNSANGNCFPFEYYGEKGNQNNFNSLDECQSACLIKDDWQSPCLNNEEEVSELKNCSLIKECPNNYFCHFGYDDSTTICCPKTIKITTTKHLLNFINNECLLSLHKGDGIHSLNRWFYNKETKKCEPFLYKGIHGNENNFLTKKQCENSCRQQKFEESHSKKNPCPIGEPLISMEQQMPIFCNPFKENSCPPTYWCHFGFSSNTSMCCPKTAQESCILAPVEGVFDDNNHMFISKTRWFFDIFEFDCKPFQFRGLKGNANNFATIEDCELNCLINSINPCLSSSNSLIINNEYPLCSITNPTCPKDFSCHIGQNSKTTLCCPNSENPCQLPPSNSGIGKANLMRWSFNSFTGKCQLFKYFGLKGNANNFLNKQECEEKCQPKKRTKAIKSTCYIGEALRNGNQFEICLYNYDCPKNYFCVVGINNEHGQCCPLVIGGDPCGQPMDRGEGNSQLPRWYWEENTQNCQPFIFNGKKGTQNNFLSQDECERFCSVEVNPCRLPIALPLTQCVPGPNTCGNRKDLWCHVGATSQTTVCCPAEVLNRCVQPIERGIGNSILERWFYNPQMSQCQPFTYSGLKGNQNNFMTREECDFNCLPNPCSSGMPFLTIDGRAQNCALSASMSTCPANYWCHIGADPSTTVCCPDANQNPCQLPMSSGDGLANLERFYYDQNTKACRAFLYKGLKGNQNNYLSMRACELACQPLDNPCIGQPATGPNGQVMFCSATNKDTCPVNFWCHLGATPETTVCCPGATNQCSVPLAPGTGNSGLARWYYNADERECVSFQYNGKRGNQNNFLTQMDCQRTCPEQLCLLSIDRGACSGRQTRYAFNRQTGQCVPFEYTGCGGNLNNFPTMADCENTCAGVGF